jgi:hypothetical protein
VYKAKEVETMKRNGIWKMELDRFGYTLVVVGKTKEECDAAMRDEYIKTYAKWNDINEAMLRAVIGKPILDENGERVEYDPRNEFLECYEKAFEDNTPRFYEFGKVEWE